MSQWTIWGTLDLSSSSRGDSPARTSPRREGAWDSSEESAVPYGWRCLESSGLAHRLGSSLRTFLLSVCEGSTPSSLAWRRRATPRGRWWWVLGRSGHRTGGTESGSSGGEWATPTTPSGGGRVNGPHVSPTGKCPDGSKRQVDLSDQVRKAEWPTPTAAEPYGSNRGGAMGRDGQPVRPSLEGAAREWPTPTMADADRASDTYHHGEKNPTLRGAARMEDWPTPTARDWRSTCASPETHEKNSRPLSEVAGLDWPTPKTVDGRPKGNAGGNRKSPGLDAMARSGQPGEENRSTNGSRPGSLNPAWVEALMGAPPGWTDLPGEAASALWATRIRRTSRI